METDNLKILLALERKWVASVNGVQFLSLGSSDISIAGSTIRLGAYAKQITDVRWLRPDIVRIRARSKFYSQEDTITLYAGDRLPATADLRRRRRAFQVEIGKALCRYFGTQTIQRQMLFSDRQNGIGGAYPRFLIGSHAVITVDPDEPSSVVNGLVRAALLWRPLVQRPLVAVVPYGRHHCISARLRAMPEVRQIIEWLQWDGDSVQPLSDLAAEPETFVKPFAVYQEQRTSRSHETMPAHDEARLESNLTGEVRQILPSVDIRHVYPQVPSFVGEERNIIDLLTITMEGRLVVIEIKASSDPELPFQALDYWIAVERHRRARDFQSNGYFSGRNVCDQPALLILVAPLLTYHKTSRRLIRSLPADVPLMEIGLNQTWKKEIKVLRRQGMVS